MTNETSSLEDEEELGFSPAECREWLEADVLAGLQEVWELCMDSARALGAKMKEDDADLVRLNAALVKAARAVRQTSVLQLEVAGLRRQAGTREPVAANGNEPARQESGSRTGPSDYERFVYEEKPDEIEWDRLSPHMEVEIACRKLQAAMARISGRQAGCSKPANRSKPRCATISATFPIPRPTPASAR